MRNLVKVGLASAAAAAALSLSGGVFAADSPLGVWIDHTGRGAVEITDCGGALCGKVVWVADQANLCGRRQLQDPQGEGGRAMAGRTSPGGDSVAAELLSAGQPD